MTLRYDPAPVRENVQLCDGQKVVLLALTYGELSLMLPVQLVQAPLLTAFGVMLRVIAFCTLTLPHSVTCAVVLPEYPLPDGFIFTVKALTASPGGANSPESVSVQVLLQLAVNCQVSVQVWPGLPHAWPPGVVRTCHVSGTDPVSGALSVYALSGDDAADVAVPQRATMVIEYCWPADRPV